MDNNEFAVFTKYTATCLLARGFKLKNRTKLAWIFEDSPLLQKAVSELTEDCGQLD